MIEKNLKIINRYSWFQEEQNNELEKSNIIIDPDSAWEKISYPLYFDSNNLSMLKKIASWREKLSIKYDIPKRWILSDSMIIKVMITNEHKAQEIIENIKEKYQSISKICLQYDVPVPAAALQFSYSNKLISSMILGIDRIEQIQQNFENLNYPIPKELWDNLIKENLLNQLYFYST